jgi:hypothetical protein
MMQGGDSIQSYKAVDIWIFGYKLHLVSSTGSLIVPLSADFTQTDVQDNQIYSATHSLLHFHKEYVSWQQQLIQDMIVTISCII